MRRYFVLLLVTTLVISGIAPWSSAAENASAVIPDPDAYTCDQAGFITFEALPDGASLLEQTFHGLQFTTTDGFTWRVGDFATGNYNGKYPAGDYTSQGTHWAWLGPTQGSGRIDFSDGPASRVSLLVSNATPVALDAYDTAGRLLETAGPAPSTHNTGAMAELRIARATADIAYVIVHDSGNTFVVDAICTDAPAVSDAPQRATVTVHATTGGESTPQGTVEAIIGTTLRIDATPHTDYMFAGWEVDGTSAGSANPLMLTVDTNHAVKALFTRSPSTTLTLSASSGGSVIANPAQAAYAPSDVVALIPQPNAGFIFVGWMVDGVFHGWANSATVTMSSHRTVQALFAPRPAFRDVPSSHPQYDAITQLAARGIIRGYGDGRFGPADTTLRAQMAALICRAIPSDRLPGQMWDAEDHATPFLDRGPVDANLWRNVGTLAHYGVAKGYSPTSYRPLDNVLEAQVISFITRAMVAKGYWQPVTTDDPTLYTNISLRSGHRLDVLTYYKNAGVIPGTNPTAKWTTWDKPASRAWFAQAFWQALDSYWKVDRVP